MTNNRVKLFYGNQHRVISLSNKWAQFKFYFKLWLGRTAKTVAIAWIVTGGILLGKHVAPQNTVYAENRVEVPVNEDIPILERIAQCESGRKQYAKNGQVIFNANTNGSVDSGYMQINLTVWGKTATNMGYDLTKESDNKAFGRWIFLNYGSEPWYSSKECWLKK